MSSLFKRCWRVTAWRDSIPADPTNYKTTRISNASALEITDLRVKFTINRALTKTPNQCDITIYNLQPSTRADIEVRPLTVQLEAGYDDTPRLLFNGDLLFGMTKLDRPDWLTLLQLGDGVRSYAHSRVNKSYAGGTSIRTVLTDVTASMGLVLPKGIADASFLDKQFASGMVTAGPARDHLTQLLASFGYHWSIQNGQLQILDDQAVSSTSAIPLDEEHGMIGTPEFGSPPKSGKPPHVHVKSLLHPEIAPGALIKLTSKVKNGLFRAEQVRHQGDTHGTGWETSVELKPY